MGSAALGVALWPSVGLGPLRALTAALVVVWCTRFVLELFLPVPIPFFTLHSPSWLFETLIAVLIAVLATPEILVHVGVVSR